MAGKKLKRISLQSKDMDNPPELMLSPMIDMIFLLLVFFILSTMYMTEIKTIEMRLPAAENYQVEMKTNFNVTVKEDGQLFLADKPVSLEALISSALAESEKDQDFAVIIRADRETNYHYIISLLDRLKGSGLTRIALATEAGEGE